jgi:hypothetical protein
MQRLPTDKLAELLSLISSAKDRERLSDHVSRLDADFAALTRAVRDGLSDLVEYADSIDVGWEMNHGFRCDVNFALFLVTACDNYHLRSRTVEFTACTAEGALAGALLAMLQLRAEAYPDP